MDGIVDEADAVEVLKAKLRESRVKNEDEPKPRATKSQAAVSPPSAASTPIKVKQEPLSDDNAPSGTSRASSSKAQGVPSVPKRRPTGRSGPAGTSAGGTSGSATSAAKAATLPAPLIRRKASKSNLPFAPRVDKKGKRAARVPLDMDAIEISSDEPQSEDE